MDSVTYGAIGVYNGVQLVIFKVRALRAVCAYSVCVRCMRSARTVRAVCAYGARGVCVRCARCLRTARAV